MPLALIRLYQATLSKTLPPDTCRFYPSCSHYGYQAIYKYGLIKGGLMAGWRVLEVQSVQPRRFRSGAVRLKELRNKGSNKKISMKKTRFLTLLVLMVILGSVLSACTGGAGAVSSFPGILVDSGFRNSLPGFGRARLCGQPGERDGTLALPGKGRSQDHFLCAAGADRRRAADPGRLRP